jgi:uncharacterized protein
VLAEQVWTQAQASRHGVPVTYVLLVLLTRGDRMFISQRLSGESRRPGAGMPLDRVAAPRPEYEHSNRGGEDGMTRRDGAAGTDRSAGSRGGHWNQVLRRVEGWLPMPITYVVPSTQTEHAATIARRRKVVAATSLAGAGLLGVSLSTKPDSVPFYLLTLSVAATWSGGGLASGPLHLGWLEDRDHDLRRPLVTPIATGVAAFGVFYAGALLARRIPFLADAISSILEFAEQGKMPLVLLTAYANGLGEEIFFRGALYSALPGPQAAVASTGIYALATSTTRNPSLVLAALVMGSLFAAQRRATGGLEAPVLTHLTWSTLMVRYLPPLFRHAQ